MRQLSINSPIKSISPLKSQEFNVKIINSIKKKYPKIRDKSKAPTFSLTYNGTHHTLMKDLGFTYDEAISIESNYHKLYVESDEWKEAKLLEAHKNGYGVLAFGLKLRCPLYSKSVYGSSSMSAQAAGSSRTLGNAFTQSYGLLNNRAVNATMETVYKSPYRHSIRPCAQIHDASYYLIKDDAPTAHFLNEQLIKEMNWQELDPIKHDEVKLEANLDIYTERWLKCTELPNNCSIEHIQEVLDSAED